jgi:hypothetical protein
MAAKKTKKSQFVVVRSYAAGVHVGTLVSKRDSGGRMVVKLSNARRVWRWKGANSLHELALNGPSEDYTRISEPVPSIEVSDVVEVIDATDAAKANLERSRWGV